jgi:hypothetical protein
MTNGNLTSSQNVLFVNFCVHCLTSESKTLETLQYDMCEEYMFYKYKLHWYYQIFVCNLKMTRPNNI